MIFNALQKFFWTDSGVLLDTAAVVFEQVEQLDEKDKKTFWADRVPKELLKKLNALPDKPFAKEIIKTLKADTKKMVECCKVRRSQNIADIFLHCFSRGEISREEFETKTNQSGKMSHGNLRLDEKKWAIRQVEMSKNVNARGVGSVINIARRENDPQFFIDLGAALKMGKYEPNGLRSPVPRFLVDWWCGQKGEQGLDHRQLDGKFIMPPLCVFTDQALDDYFTSVLNLPTQLDAIRKSRQRLGLIQLKQAHKIRAVKVNPADDSILFN